MYAYDARPPRRRHLAVDRCRRFLTRLGFARLFGTLLGFTWFADVYAGNDDAPGKGERGRLGRGIPPFVAVRGERWCGRRHQIHHVFIAALLHDLVISRARLIRFQCVAHPSSRLTHVFSSFST